MGLSDLAEIRFFSTSTYYGCQLLVAMLILISPFALTLCGIFLIR